MGVGIVTNRKTTQIQKRRKMGRGLGMVWPRSEFLHKGGEGRCSLGDSQGAGGRPQPGWEICQPIITLTGTFYLGEKGMSLLGVCLSLHNV